MPGPLLRLASLSAAVCLMASPLRVCAAAGADGIDISVPSAYAAVPADGALPGVAARAWVRMAGPARHELLATAGPLRGDLASEMDALSASLKERGATVVAIEPARPMCGAAAYRVVAFSERLTYEYRVVALGGRLLSARYTHPAGSLADAEALGALSTLCDGPHQPAVPPGWSLHGLPLNGGVELRSPDGTSTLTAFVRRDRGVRPAPYTFSGAKPEIERDERCGAATVHHLAAVRDGRWREIVDGTVRGYRYERIYTRPESTPNDPAAVAMLRSFCTETASEHPASPAPPGAP